MIGRAVVQEGYNRIQQFPLEYYDGKQWQALEKGTTLGAHRVFEFNPVTAQRFRLNVTKATSAPAI